MGVGSDRCGSVHIEIAQQETLPSEFAIVNTETVTHSGASKIGLYLPWREWRALVLGGVAAYSVFAPYFALRYGAVLCSAILLSLIKQVRIKAADIFAALLTLWTALSLLWAVDLPVTEGSLANQLAVLAIFLSVRLAVSNSKQLAIVALGFLGGCLYAICELIVQNQNTNLTFELSADRFGIQGVNLNYMAYSLTTGLAVSVLLWRTLRPGPMRLLLIGTVPILCFGLAKNGSRGAIAGAVMMLLWVAACRVSRKIGLLIPVGFVSIAALSIFTGWSDGALRLLVRGGAGRSTGDIAGRLATWPYARESISSHPLLGIGAGGFRTINPHGIGAHNVPLEVASGLGLIGLALLIAVAYSALMTGTQELERGSRCLLVGALIAASGTIILSGHWEYSPAGWFGLALFSRIAVLPPSALRIRAKVGGNLQQRLRGRFARTPV